MPRARRRRRGRRRAGSGPAIGSETWRDRNAPLSFALRLEKVVIFATVALVILVAALNLVSNIALLVVEKKRDLGVFTTMGAAPRSLARIYLVLGAAIGATRHGDGTRSRRRRLAAPGAIRSSIPLPPDVYLFTHVPFAVHPREVLRRREPSPSGPSLAAALLPARAAPRIAPGEATGLSR